MTLLLITSLSLIVLGFFCMWLSVKGIINHTFVLTAEKIAIITFLTGVTLLCAYFTNLLFTLNP